MASNLHCAILTKDNTQADIEVIFSSEKETICFV